MLAIVKALMSLLIAVAAFAPSLILWWVMHYLDRHEREHDRKRVRDVRSFTTDAILNRILRRD